MKNNTAKRTRKNKLVVVSNLSKEATVIPMQSNSGNNEKPLVYLMPPQPQGYLKGKDNDCL